MKLKWERIFDIEDIKNGDIIQANPKSACVHYFCIEIFDITTSYTPKYYCYYISYKHTIDFLNNKIIKTCNPGSKLKDKNLNSCLLYHECYEDSWIEKLILPDKINNLEDEIDLLLDCVFN